MGLLELPADGATALVSLAELYVVNYDSTQPLHFQREMFRVRKMSHFQMGKMDVYCDQSTRTKV